MTRLIPRVPNRSCVNTLQCCTVQDGKIGLARVAVCLGIEIHLDFEFASVIPVTDLHEGECRVDSICAVVLARIITN